MEDHHLSCDGEEHVELPRIDRSMEETDQDEEI